MFVYEVLFLVWVTFSVQEKCPIRNTCYTKRKGVYLGGQGRIIEKKNHNNIILICII